MTTPVPDPPPVDPPPVEPPAGAADFDPFRYGRPEPGSPAAAAFPHLFDASRAPTPMPYPPPGAWPTPPGAPWPDNDVSPYAAASGRPTAGGPAWPPAPGAPPYGAPPYGAPYGAPPYGAPRDESAPYGSGPYGPPPYGGSPQGAPTYGSAPYGPGGGPPTYGSPSYGSPGYGTQYGYGGPPYGYPATTSSTGPHGSEAGGANGRAVAGFVLGLLAAVCFWLTVADLPFIVLGLVFSVLGLQAARRGGPHRGLAVAGIALAVVGAVAATAFTVVVLVRINSCTDTYGRNTAPYNQCVRFQRSP